MGSDWLSQRKEKDSPMGGGWNRQRQWQADQQKRRKQLKIKYLRDLRNPGWDSEGDKKRKRENTVWTSGNWRGWRNGGWSLKEGKKSKEKMYSPGEEEHRKRLRKLRNNLEYRQWELETLRTSSVSLLSCFINLYTRKIMGNLNNFSSSHLK